MSSPEDPEGSPTKGSDSSSNRAYQKKTSGVLESDSPEAESSTDTLATPDCRSDHQVPRKDSTTSILGTEIIEPSNQLNSTAPRTVDKVVDVNMSKTNLIEDAVADLNQLCRKESVSPVQDAEKNTVAHLNKEFSSGDSVNTNLLDSSKEAETNMNCSTCVSAEQDETTDNDTKFSSGYIVCTDESDTVHLNTDLTRDKDNGRIEKDKVTDEKPSSDDEGTGQQDSYVGRTSSTETMILMPDTDIGDCSKKTMAEPSDLDFSEIMETIVPTPGLPLSETSSMVVNPVKFDVTDGKESTNNVNETGLDNKEVLSQDFDVGRTSSTETMILVPDTDIGDCSKKTMAEPCDLDFSEIMETRVPTPGLPLSGTSSVETMVVDPVKFDVTDGKESTNNVNETGLDNKEVLSQESYVGRTSSTETMILVPDTDIGDCSKKTLGEPSDLDFSEIMETRVPTPGLPLSRTSSVETMVVDPVKFDVTDGKESMDNANEAGLDRKEVLSVGSQDSELVLRWDDEFDDEQLSPADDVINDQDDSVKVAEDITESIDKTVETRVESHETVKNTNDLTKNLDDDSVKIAEDITGKIDETIKIIEKPLPSASGMGANDSSKSNTTDFETKQGDDAWDDGEFADGSSVTVDSVVTSLDKMINEDVVSEDVSKDIPDKVTAVAEIAVTSYRNMDTDTAAEDKLLASDDLVKTNDFDMEVDTSADVGSSKLSGGKDMNHRSVSNNELQKTNDFDMDIDEPANDSFVLGCESTLKLDPDNIVSVRNNTEVQSNPAVMKTEGNEESMSNTSADLTKDVMNKDESISETISALGSSSEIKNLDTTKSPVISINKPDMEVSLSLSNDDSFEQEDIKNAPSDQQGLVSVMGSVVEGLDDKSAVVNKDQDLEKTTAEESLEETAKEVPPHYKETETILAEPSADEKEKPETDTAKESLSSSNETKEVELSTESKTETPLPRTKEITKISSPLHDIEAFIRTVDPITGPLPGFVDQMAPDTEDEVPEVTDSLGLLAESSRVMDDDEEADDQDTPEEDEDDDDDADADADIGDSNFDESSDLIAEQSADQSEDQSEDSNAMNSEAFMPKLLPSCSYKDPDDTSDNVKETEDPVEVNSEMGEIGVTFSMASSEIDIAENAELDKEVEPDIVDDVEIAETTIGDIAPAGSPPEATNHCTDIEMALPEVTDTEPKIDTPSTEAPAEPLATTADPTAGAGQSILQNLLRESKTEDAATSKTLAITNLKHVVNIVDLEESSSEDDVAEIGKPPDEMEEMTSVNIPTGIEIMSSGEVISEITTVKGEIVISGVPKPPPHKFARLNTGELTIKTGSASDSTLIIPEAKAAGGPRKTMDMFGLEVFNLDSDEDDNLTNKETKPKTDQQHETPEPKAKDTRKKETGRPLCVNPRCKSGTGVPYFQANHMVFSHFDSAKKRGLVCENCYTEVAVRAQTLIDGIKDFTPLLQLNTKEIRPDLVEISDSDSDDDQDLPRADEKIGLEAALALESQLASIINETWDKYKMDARLQDAQDSIDEEIARIDKENKEIHQMLDECQVATDKLRGSLYATFEPAKKELKAVVIYDMPGNVYVCPETSTYETRQSKRRLSSATETPEKRVAIALGYPSLSADKPAPGAREAEFPHPGSSVSADVTSSKIDDDKDVSVVHLSAEAAPADLPPLGEVTRPPLAVGAPVFAMRNAFGSWLRARVVDITPRGNATQANQFTMVRVKFESKTSKNPYKLLPARCIAYAEPAGVRLTIGTRCIALFKNSVNTAKRVSYYSGVVAEVPNPVNKYRYLVFFDDGYAQYVHHCDTRLVVESSVLVWEEVHPFSREFVRQYLLAYPERPMVRLHTGQNIKAEWNGKWWITRVIQVDASLVQVHFDEDNRTEWIYRGSTRLAPLYLELQAAERTRNRPLPRNRQTRHLNMPYVEYTRSDEQEATKADAERARIQQERVEQELRRQRAVAKKSTAAPSPAAGANLDSVTSRVVYYTPKNAVRPLKMVAHSCGPRCKRSDVLALSDLRTYNPLAKPLLSGWERQLVRYKGHKEIMYRAPCGRRLRDICELHAYLRITQSDMGVDLFDFAPATHCLAEFVLNKCIVGKKDLSHGRENVPVPCVNYYDDSLPEFCSYNTERTPTAGVPLNIDPEFLCGCDCTDDCQDKSKCACWKMTLEGARTIGMDPRRVGYEYKRLLEPLPSGIYECNSRCKCKHTCLNRVAQHPLQLKLQVFKTLNRGWGIRALNDVPKGAFLCVYAGNLLTDATANLDGLNEGDEYLAELDYIEVVEQMKEGFESDIPEKDKELDKKGSSKASSSEYSSSSEDDQPSKNEIEDNDFQPGYIPQPTGGTVFSKHLRKRDKSRKDKPSKDGGERNDEKEDDCITISDDEELREPSRFMAQAGMGANEFISKYRSVRTLYGKDESCYIMDAKVQGNIGRYLNHSCAPNVFVQNVFVDTHDPRFPWVAFFALSHIKAGTELTWNYNYDIGSVPSKTLYCYCGAPNCRGRLL